VALKKSVVPALALFSSLGTLVCCALPALFVTLGAGAALAGVVTAVPQLIWLSEHKVLLFVFAGCMLSLSAAMRYTSRNAPCPIEAAQAQACARLRRWSSGIFAFSLAVYVIGFYFAFIAQYMR
jgi:hypothetical protein